MEAVMTDLHTPSTSTVHYKQLIDKDNGTEILNHIKILIADVRSCFWCKGLFKAWVGNTKETDNNKAREVMYCI